MGHSVKNEGKNISELGNSLDKLCKLGSIKSSVIFFTGKNSILLNLFVLLEKIKDPVELFVIPGISLALIFHQFVKENSSSFFGHIVSSI